MDNRVKERAMKYYESEMMKSKAKFQDLGRKLKVWMDDEKKRNEIQKNNNETYRQIAKVEGGNEGLREMKMHGIRGKKGK